MDFTDLQRHWQALGEEDPLWAILTVPGKRGGRWDLADFLATGREEVQSVLSALTERGVVVGRRRALDFGCGVGRLTRALSDHFDRCDGVDLAPSMIERARAINCDREQVRFRCNKTPDLRWFKSGSVDFVLALYVLQHMEPALMRGYLREFMRVLRPGGLAYFNLPERVVLGAPLPAPGRRASVQLAGELPDFVAGRFAPIELTVRNESSLSWPVSAQILVGDHWRTAAGEMLVADDARALIDIAVQPGEERSIVLEVVAPGESGDYVLEVDLVQEQVCWFGDWGSPTLCLPVSVTRPERRRQCDSGGTPMHGPEPGAFRPTIEMYALGREQVAAVVEAAGGVVLAAIPADRAGPLFPSVDYIVERRPDAYSHVQLPGASIDLPADGSVVRSRALRIAGWAATDTGPCAHVELTVNGQPVGRARLGGVRPDVERATGRAAARSSGFELIVDLLEVPGLARSAELGGRGSDMEGTSVELPTRRIAVELAGQQRRDDARSADPALVVRRSRRAREGSAAPRLLIFAHDLDYGGAQLFLLDLIGRIRDKEPDPVLLAFRDGPLRGSFERVGCDVHISPPLPLGGGSEYALWTEELTAWVAAARCDVALINSVLSFPATEACRRPGLPSVWAIHESYPVPLLWEALSEGSYPGLQCHAEDALNAAGVLAFASHSTRVACYEPYLRSARCVTLRYGIDVDGLDAWRVRFDRAQARRQRQISDDATVILCMGAFVPRKGQIPLVQAFARIADRHPVARLELIGSHDDDRADAVRAAAAAFGVDHRVAIRPVTADARPSYGSADLMVCASDVESFPRSVLDAMALRLPVLATNVFGLSELITDGHTGWLCEPRDVQALADALDRVLRLDPQDRDQIAENANAMVNNEYRSDVCSRAWGQLLRDVAAEGENFRHD